MVGHARYFSAVMGFDKLIYFPVRLNGYISPKPPTGRFRKVSTMLSRALELRHFLYSALCIHEYSALLVDKD